MIDIWETMLENDEMWYVFNSKGFLMAQDPFTFRDV